jgi:hypothetical protein
MTIKIINNHDSVEDLEFEMLEKINFIENYKEKLKELADKTKNLHKYGFLQRILLIGEVGDLNIYARFDGYFERYCTISKKELNLKGNILVIGESREGKLFEVDEETFSNIETNYNSYLSISYNGLRVKRIMLERLEKGEKIDISEIALEVDREIAKEYEEEEREREEQKKLRNSKYNPNSQENKDLKQGKYTGLHYVIDGIKATDGELEITLEKPIQEIFTLEELGNVSYLDYFVALLREKKEGYSYSKGINKYTLKFKDKSIFVDGVRVEKDRLHYYLMRADGTSERINELKKLNSIKVSFIEQKEIYLGNNHLSTQIEVSFLGKDTFKVKLFDREVIKTWKELGVFKASTQSINRYFTARECFDLASLMGMTKEELFYELKTLKMFNKLEGEQ